MDQHLQNIFRIHNNRQSVQWRSSFVGNLASIRHKVSLIEFNAKDTLLFNFLFFSLLIYWLDLLKMFEILTPNNFRKCLPILDWLYMKCWSCLYHDQDLYKTRDTSGITRHKSLDLLNMSGCKWT